MYIAPFSHLQRACCRNEVVACPFNSFSRALQIARVSLHVKAQTKWRNAARMQRSRIQKTDFGLAEVCLVTRSRGKILYDSYFIATTGEVMITRPVLSRVAI